MDHPSWRAPVSLLKQSLFTVLYYSLCSSRCSRLVAETMASTHPEWLGEHMKGNAGLFFSLFGREQRVHTTRVETGKTVLTSSSAGNTTTVASPFSRASWSPPPLLQALAYFGMTYGACTLSQLLGLWWCNFDFFSTLGFGLFFVGTAYAAHSRTEVRKRFNIYVSLHEVQAPRCIAELPLPDLQSQSSHRYLNRSRVLWI